MKTTELTARHTSRETVWDYPRPPRLEGVTDRLRVIFAGETICESVRGFRILETSHPPVYYIPMIDVRQQFLRPAPGISVCEFKGKANYWDLEVRGRSSPRAAWSYRNPAAQFESIKDCVAFYPTRVDQCWVGTERAEAQDGDFYGGWITSGIVGPFKGGPGTYGW